MKKIRKLKIYSKHRARRWDSVTVPEIRLQGNWLERSGFREGSEIEVREDDGVIVVRRV